MAEAAARGFSVSRPWGDSSAYDVGVELGQHFLRVQVKSTSYRRYAGYACHLDPRIRKGGYKLEEVDLFAIYVIPEDIWYVIPASVVLCPTPRTTVTLCPLTRTKKYRFHYERYRAAWGLLAKTKQELCRAKSCRT